MAEGVNFRVTVDLHHLREFVAIAESGSFSKAARRLRIAQPPLSRHIRSLEHELGVKLFVRTATGVEITPEGSLLLAQARVVLDDTSALLELASRTKLGLASTLRVAMAPGLCEVVNRIRVHLVAGTTRLAIEGTDMPSSRQYEALRRRSIDVGLLRHVPEEPGIMSTPLFAERFVVMVSAGSPLARRRSVRLKHLAGQRLLLQDRDWATLARDKILSLYVAAGFTPSFVTLQAIPGNQASMLSVASGEAICFALAGPISRSYLPVNGVEVVPLDEPGAELSVEMAWRTNEVSPVVCEFLRAARDVFAAGDESAGHRLQSASARSR
ncbi:MAG TPA: LysR family transcriptional regulator [Vicinamibacterales bacterium]|nr:LysR family transcriptional regulator [Vicinamibacterales bacterium]